MIIETNVKIVVYFLRKRYLCQGQPPWIIYARRELVGFIIAGKIDSQNFCGFVIQYAALTIQINWLANLFPELIDI